MKQLRLLFPVFFLAFAPTAHAQYNRHGASFVGFGIGREWMDGESRFDPPVSANTNFGYQRAHGTTAVFAGQISHLSGRDKGINWGYYGGFTLGGTLAKWKGQNPGFVLNERDYEQELYLNSDLRAGIQAAYKIDSSQCYFGIRYYQIFQIKQMYDGYSAADDGACIGLFGAYRNLSFDIGYGSQKIPGIKTNSDGWDFLQCGIRYRLGRTSSWLLGLSYQYNILKLTSYHDPLSSGAIIVQQAHPQCLYFHVSLGF